MKPILRMYLLSGLNSLHVTPAAGVGQSTQVEINFGKKGRYVRDIHFSDYSGSNALDFNVTTDSGYRFIQSTNPALVLSLIHI